MKNNYINSITFVALFSILFLQGMWLYKTYKLLETDFKKNISDRFAFSVEEETMLRLEDPARKEERKGKMIRGVHPQNDRYTNNRAFQDHLYKEDYPISLEKVDSIFQEAIQNSFRHLDYSLLISDSLTNPTAFVHHGKNPFNDRFAYKETIQLRNINPEYISLTVSSPHRIIFGKMLLLLTGSFILAVIIVYGLILQITIINRQKKIAELRQDFTHAMVHNIKNPITSILIGISSLKSCKIEDKPQMKEQHYKIITQESERILHLANKVLAIARFEEQRVILSKQAVNLSDLLGRLIEKYTVYAKKVHFYRTLNEVETIYADQDSIYEAFDNLIDNAIKYSKETQDVEIYITSLHSGNNTRIIFKDMGIGISGKDQKVIFRKFARASSVIKNVNKTNGFGLGLHFVFQVIKAHGGTIKVNSRLGSYSEFIINLPDK